MAGSAPIDFCAMAMAAGYASATRFEQAAHLREAIASCLTQPAPALIELTIAPTAPRFGPTFLQPEQPDARFERMGKEAQRLMRNLGTLA